MVRYSNLNEKSQPWKPGYHSPHDPPWMDLEVNTVSLLVYLAWYAHRKPRWRRPPNELRRACKEIPGPIDVSEWQRLLRIAHDEYRRIPLAVLLRLSEDQRRWVAKEYSRLRLLQSVADDARSSKTSVTI